MTLERIRPDYRIHGRTIWILGDGIYSNYMVHGDKVSKMVQLANGDEILEPFHTIGELPMNTEAKLINELREEGKL